MDTAYTRGTSAHLTDVLFPGSANNRNTSSMYTLNPSDLSLTGLNGVIFTSLAFDVHLNPRSSRIDSSLPRSIFNTRARVHHLLAGHTLRRLRNENDTKQTIASYRYFNVRGPIPSGCDVPADVHLEYINSCMNVRSSDFRVTALARRTLSFTSDRDMPSVTVSSAIEPSSEHEISVHSCCVWLQVACTGAVYGNSAVLGTSSGSPLTGDSSCSFT